MKIEVMEEVGNRCIINIEIPATDVEREKDFLAKEIQPKAEVKGFRVGNAPLAMVKSKYRIHLLNEISRKLIVRGSSEALKREELRNSCAPELLEEFRMSDKKKYAGVFQLDGVFSFSISVEMPPKIELKDYKGIEVDIETKDFELWFKKEIVSQQNLYGEKEAVQRPAVFGDELFVNFSCSVDAVSLPSEENYRLVIGSNDFSEDFENAFIGRAPGEKFSITIPFAEDDPKTEFAGKTCAFECELKELFELVPHELDDELAQMLSYSDVDDMMESYQKKWEEEYSEQLKARLYNAIMDQLLEIHPFDPPEAWVQAEVPRTVQRLGISNMESSEALLDGLRSVSERTVKIAYLVDKIYEAEPELHISAEELQQNAMEEAKKMQISVEELNSKLKEQGTYEGFVRFYEQQKVVNFLIDNAKTKEGKDD